MATVSDAATKRALGCLYGQAIGDALGATYEFSTREETVEHARVVKGKRRILPIVGGGPFGLMDGQVTDDTELAMSLAHSLLKRKTYDPETTAEAYLTWFKSGAFGVGQTTKAALSNIRNKGEELSAALIYERMKTNADRRNGASLSNGCLMRISPLAIAGTNWQQESLIKTAQIDCSLTNPNPIAQEAVGCYVAAIQSLVISGDKEEAYKVAKNLATVEILKKHFEDAKKKPTPTVINLGGKLEKMEAESRYMGYLGVALQVSFYNLLHAKSFSEGLEKAILLGGDTDTNGCITGALLGAKFGVDAIPDEWKRAVVSVKCERHQRAPWSNLSQIESIAVNLLNCTQPNFSDTILLHM